MLRQSLKPLGGEALLEKAGIDPTARPEELSVNQFAALARALAPSSVVLDEAHGMPGWPAALHALGRQDGLASSSACCRDRH